ncbi:MAG: leucine-rich repeat domain-containing protein [Verrucomicrobiota bacterium]
MSSATDGLTIARARIAKEMEKRTGVLDLGDLGLTEWPNELWHADHLTTLNLGVGWTDERNGFNFAASGIAYAPNLLPSEPARACWARLPNLRILSLAGTRGEGSPWGDLNGLETLTELRVLDLSFTEADDLAPLVHLRHLELLDASYTFISDVAPLSGLTALRYLDLTHTKVTDLSPLKGHATLRIVR